MSGLFHRIQSMIALALLLVMAEARSAVSESFLQSHQDRLDRLFTQLDASHPVMARVQANWSTGQRQAAAQQLLDYFSQREPSDLLLRETQPPPNFMQIAADALEDIFTLQNVRAAQPRRADGSMDWNYRGPRNDKEWAWMLNRHGHFISMIHAWQATGDTRYIEKVDSDLYDWLNQHSFPGRLTFSPAWRALEAARRILHSWNLVFFSLRDQPGFRAETRLLMLASLLEHGDNLRNHASFWGGNHLLTEKTALALLSVGWPELAPSREWLSYSVRVTKAELSRQVYPDGAYQELSNHYQRVVARNALYFLQLVKASPYYDPDFELEQRVEALWNYIAYVMRPDGYGPLNNAGDLEHNRTLLGEALNTFDRPDWNFLARMGSGQVPVHTPSIFFPWAGHAISRDDWEQNHHWSFFNIGPHGTAHQHEDNLHLSVFAAGKLLLGDAGRYTYAPGPWRNFFKGPESHNVLLLDGRATRPQRLRTRTPLNRRAEIHESYDVFSGVATFPARGLRGPSYHQRTVYYQRGAFWLVIDRVLTSGNRKLSAHWQFGPEVNTESSRNFLQLWHSFPTTYVPGPQQLFGSESPIAGWKSPNYNVRIPVLQERYQINIRGTTTLVWVIAENVPTLLPQLELIQLDNTGLRVLWHAPDGIHTIDIDL